DIAMTDPYPIPGDVMAVKEPMVELKDAFRFRKALWLVPQAFGGGEFWEREPSGPEIRAMTWLGIQEGAMGIQYFIRRHPNLFPKSRLAWNEAVRAAHEVSMIQPWLFSDEPRTRLSTGNDRILATALRHNGSTLLLVTNADNEPAAFEIDTTPFTTGDAVTIELPFENRSLTASDGQLSEVLGPLDSRAYLIGPELDSAAMKDPHNLFPNRGFEWVPSPGVPAGSYADSDHRPAYDGSTYFVDSRISRSGHNSLRLLAVTDTSHLKLSFHRMYVEAGRSYHTSLWSRHAKYSNPVTFTVEIPQVDLRRDFVTDAAWARHDLRFRATGETPFVQLEINTAGAGTFWLDDVVVTPDPLIDVVVEDGPLATFSVASQDPDARFTYRLNDATPGPYTEPLQVRSFTDVELRVQRPAWPDETITVTIPLSLATRKRVFLQTPHSPKYQGSGVGTIVDGEYGSLAFRDGKYLGFDGKDVEFTIDLVEAFEVASVVAHFLVSPDDGIHAPTFVEASTSLDGEEWRQLGRIENPSGTRHASSHHLSLTVQGNAREGQFVRVKVGSPKVIPDGYLFSGTDAWIFIDEALIHGADN
ncbi:MAG: hypothetical protein R3178_01850, partial [Rhodothermales bacterium]|nr:hypothetical protein [Rhodothermales bacterium]